MGKPIGTVFVELDLDMKGYTKKQKEILKQTQSTSLDIETNWRRIGSQSDKMYNAMRQNVNNAYNSMVNSGKLSADELVRAERAKAARIQSINEQQHGRQVGMIEKLKNNWMTAAATITAAYFAISKAWDLASQRAQYEQSRAAFRSMAMSMGADAEAVFGRVKELSGGMIDDASLTQSMNKALSLGIPIEKLGDLMLVARAKSRDMGITATQAFNDIATGIGRGSPLILDNLGLMLKLGSANEAMAASLGKTVEQLTDKEKKTAILNATLEAGQEALSRYNLEVKTTKERMESLTAQFTNIKSTLGDLILRIGAGLMGTFQSVASAATYLTALIMAPVSALAEATDYLGITVGKAQKYKEDMQALLESSEDLIKKADANFRLMKEGFQITVAPTPRGKGAGANGKGAGANDGVRLEEEAFKRKIKLLGEYSDALAAFYGDEAEMAMIVAEADIERWEKKKKALAEEKKAQEEINRLVMESQQGIEAEKWKSQTPAARYKSAYDAGDVSVAIEQINKSLGDQWAELEAGQSMIDLYKTAWLDANLAIYDSIQSLYSGMTSWVSSSIQGLVSGAMTAMDVVKNLGKTLLSIISDYVAKWIVSRATMAIMGPLFAKTATAAMLPAATAAAAMWAPAATLASVATFGGAAAAGGAGLMSAFAISEGIAAMAALGGAAHGGLENVPKEQTYLLDKGERVISPRQNKDLTDFLGGDSGRNAPMQINLHIDGERLASWMHRASRHGRVNFGAA